MIVFDMPSDVPPQYAPVVIAQAAQAQKGDAKTERPIGVCQLIENLPDEPRELWVPGNGLDPLGVIRNYFRSAENQKIDLQGAHISVLESPKHGTLQSITTATIEADGYEGKGFCYNPEPDYLGEDRATVLVEVGGRKIKVVHFLKVMRGVPGGTEGYDPYEERDIAQGAICGKFP